MIDNNFLQRFNELSDIGMTDITLMLLGLISRIELRAEKRRATRRETYQSICNLIFHGTLTPMISFPISLSKLFLFALSARQPPRVESTPPQAIRRERENE